MQELREGGGEAAHGLEVELRAGEPPQHGQRFGRRPAGAVGARRGHRVEGVGDVDDAGEQRDLVAPQAVRIAAPVRLLVVQLDDRQVRLEERHRPEDLRAEHGMALDDLEFVVGERAGLAEDGVADADLADVVQQRAEAQHLDLVVETCICWPMATEIALTRSEWPAV